MRVVIKPAGTDMTEGVVVPLDRLRDRLEERLMSALESWEAEKKHLEEVVARAEEKEREFRQIAEDVKRRLDALDLVTEMTREAENERGLPEASARPMLVQVPERTLAIAEQPADGEAQAIRFPMGASSRPLFTAEQRARAGALSILP